MDFYETSEVSSYHTLCCSFLCNLVSVATSLSCHGWKCLPSMCH